MKILLILASGDSDPLKNLDPFMPLIFPILASVAPEHNYTFIDLLKDNESALNYNKNYDLVGISYRISAKDKAYEIADRYRKNNIPVVLGGPQASTLPFEAIEHADAVVVGEGEKLWQIILNDLKNNNLKNFYVNSPVEFNSKSYSYYQIYDFPALKNIIEPKRDIIKKKYSFDVIYSSRGCPVDCSFCTVTKLFGKNIRLRDVDSVVEEIKTLRRKFYLVDDTIFGRPSCYDHYLELYQKMQKIKKKRFWTGQANLDAAADPKGRQVIDEAAKSGFSFASIGIETIDPENQASTGVDKKLGVSKQNMIDELKDNIFYIQKQGISISGWFTIGLENDTIKSCLKTIDFCIETNIFPVFSPIQVFEGTRLYEQLNNEGKLIDRKTNVTNIKHKHLSNQDLLYIMEIALKKGYSTKIIIKRTFYHWKLFIKLKRGHVDLVYRTMYAFIAQLRIKRIQAKELKRFKSRLKSN